MATRNPLLQPPKPYRSLRFGPNVDGRSNSDHVLGETAYPGGRLWGIRPENRVFELGAGYGLLAQPGDLLTVRQADIAVTGDDPSSMDTTETTFSALEGYLGHPHSVKTDTDANRGWGDMSGGVYQALNYVDNRAEGDGAQKVSVYGSDALIDVILDGDIKVGDKVGSDLRVQPASNAARTNPTTNRVYNTNSDPTNAAFDVTLYMRVRKMTIADLTHADRGKAFIGTVNEIWDAETAEATVRDHGIQKPKASRGDLGTVKVGVRA